MRGFADERNLISRVLRTIHLLRFTKKKNKNNFDDFFISKIQIPNKILDKQSEAINNFVKTTVINTYFADSYFERGILKLYNLKYYHEINYNKIHSDCNKKLEIYHLLIR